MTSILDTLDPNYKPDFPEPVDPEKDYFSELVGEGKKYKTERDLARAVMEKESLIQRQTRERLELLDDLKASRATKNMEELLDQMKELRAPQTPSNDDNQIREPVVQGKALTLEDVKRSLREEQEVNTRKSNAQTVQKKLHSFFGENYVSKVEDVASQYNVDPSFLDDLAQKNPTAFYKLMGMEEQRPQGSSILDTAPRSSRMTTPSSPSRKNWAYYEDMRKKDVLRYNSISTQNEMHSEAQKQLEHFYAP